MSKKYSRTYHLPWSKGTTSDDRFIETTKHLIGVPIVIEIKLDGSNISFTKGGVYGRSHADYTRNAWDNEMWNIHTQIKNNLTDELYIFAENLFAIHSIIYTELTSYVYIFGVRDGDIWLSWDEVEIYASILNIPTAPVLFTGVVNSEAELKEITESYATGSPILGGEREGIVVRVADAFNDKDFKHKVAKIVRPNHVKTADTQHWSKNWKKSKIIQYGHENI